VLPEGRPNPRAEAATAVLLALAGAAAVAFMVLYGVEPDTQALALSLGACLAFLAAAAILAGTRVVVRERHTEERPPMADPPAERRAAQILEEGGTGISRRRLLGGACAFAGVATATAVAAPLLSLGPGAPRRGRAARGEWADGVRLVTEGGSPVRADDLVVGSFLTAFPEGAEKADIASPVVVVRVRPGEIHPSRGREGWAPGGIMAFSQICTHAACAVTLFRYPLFRESSPAPALVCPCHYSVFDVLHDAEPVYGPAHRPLPQLPLRVARDGTLQAAGPLSGDPGPSWLLTDT
jgi:ubiquinol-cytochrome c reductase iron-sulfur subunit